MPYSSKKTGKNQITVYKKDSGEVVGHTTPEKYNDYMAALHIHSGDKASEGGIVTPIPELGLEPGKPKVNGLHKLGTAAVFPYQRQPAVEQMAEGGIVEEKQEDPEETYRKGIDAYQKGDVQGSIGYFKQAQAAGHPYAAKALMRATSATQGETPQYAKLPEHMAQGGIVGYEEGGIVGANDFDVNGGDSTTIKNLPIPPQENATEPSIDNSQVADPGALRRAAANEPATEKASPNLPGMPAGVTADDLQGYLGKQKQEIGKYGSDQQMAVVQSLLKARTGLGGSLAQGGAGLADAIMQGVARAGNPGFQEKLQNQGQQLTGETLGAMQKAHEQGLAQTEAGMRFDTIDPNSPPSKAAQGSIGQVLVSKLGYSPKQVAQMSAQQIETTANLAMKYEDIETQAALRDAMLKYQTAMGAATIQNQQIERQLQGATLQAQHPFLSLMGKLPNIGGPSGAAPSNGWKYIGKVGG